MKIFAVIIQEQEKPGINVTRTIKAITKEGAWDKARRLFPGCHVVSIEEKAEE